MSALESIQKGVTAKRIIKGVHFDWDNPEVTYTTPSQGGAASLKNDAYLLKANKAEESDLDDSQREILEAIGEEFTPLLKSDEGNTQPPSSVSTDGDTGENNDIHKDNNMTDVTREEFVALKKALAVSNAVNSIAGYAFEADLNKEIAGAVAELSAEDAVVITKAFDALVARGEAAVAVEVDKAKEAKPEEENALTKALSEEAGEAGEADEPVEKSLAERARDAQDKIQGDK